MPSLNRMITTPRVHSSGNTPLSEILFDKSTKISCVFSCKSSISSGIILSKTAALPFLKSAITFLILSKVIFVLRISFRILSNEFLTSLLPESGFLLLSLSDVSSAVKRLKY